MSLQSIMFNINASKSDKKRDAAIPLPSGVTEYRDIAYGHHGKENLLDVYIPEGAEGPLPTIVSIHGGGYVYGSKEIYRRYGMDMARRGFAFVNFNYRLAPKWRFPTLPVSESREGTGVLKRKLALSITEAISSVSKRAPTLRFISFFLWKEKCKRCPSPSL